MLMFKKVLWLVLFFGITSSNEAFSVPVFAPFEIPQDRDPVVQIRFRELYKVWKVIQKSPGILCRYSDGTLLFLKGVVDEYYQERYLRVPFATQKLLALNDEFFLIIKTFCPILHVLPPVLLPGNIIKTQLEPIVKALNQCIDTISNGYTPLTDLDLRIIGGCIASMQVFTQLCYQAWYDDLRIEKEFWHQVIRLNCFAEHMFVGYFPVDIAGVEKSCLHYASILDGKTSIEEHFDSLAKHSPCTLIKPYKTPFIDILSADYYDARYIHKIRK